MSFYIACSNAECEEQGVPKETSDGYRSYFTAGIITCGTCFLPITEEVDPPAGAVRRFDL